MGFSSEWNDLYKSNRHMSVWPWSQLVSLCLRHTPLSSSGKEFKVLEVGCGAGANLPFFLTYTGDVAALDGSEHIVALLKNKFPTISESIKVADFTKELPFQKKFNLIVDRGASVHNDTQSIKSYLDHAFNHLECNGHLIITDWFSTEHGYYSTGTSKDGDRYTKFGYIDGPFAGVGNVHFFDKELILQLTSKFKLVHLEHSITKVDGIEHQGAAWSLVLKKSEKC